MYLNSMISRLLKSIISNDKFCFIFNFLKFKCILFNNLFLLAVPFSIIESVLL